MKGLDPALKKYLRSNKLPDVYEVNVQIEFINLMLVLNFARIWGKMILNIPIPLMNLLLKHAVFPSHAKHFLGNKPLVKECQILLNNHRHLGVTVRP